MSLIAAECERRAITTVVIQLLREAADGVRPPRTLLVPFRHGFPLDRPNDAARQRRVLEAMLALAEANHPHGPILTQYEPTFP